MKRREFLAQSAAAVGLAVVPVASVKTAASRLPSISLRDQSEVMLWHVGPRFNVLHWRHADGNGILSHVVDDVCSPHYLGRVQTEYFLATFGTAEECEEAARAYFERHAWGWRAVSFGRKQPIRTRDAATGLRREAGLGDAVLVDGLQMTVCEAEQRGAWWCYELEARMP